MVLQERCSSVVTITTWWTFTESLWLATRRTTGIWFPARVLFASNFIPGLRLAQSNRHRDDCPGYNEAREWSYLLPFSTQVNNAWSCITTPSYSSMARLLIKHCDKYACNLFVLLNWSHNATYKQSGKMCRCFNLLHTPTHLHNFSFLEPRKTGVYSK